MLLKYKRRMKGKRWRVLELPEMRTAAQHDASDLLAAATILRRVARRSSREQVVRRMVGAQRAIGLLVRTAFNVCTGSLDA